MEVRPIDANAAIQAIKGIYCKDCNNYNGVRCRACNFDDAMSVIDDTPTLDYAPVKRGEWIMVWNADKMMCGVKCSECGRRVRNTGENFCPRCGARMDG